jgi:hypothetical protein
MEVADRFGSPMVVPRDGGAAGVCSGVQK